jgi:hypothetical protein
LGQCSILIRHNTLRPLSLATHMRGWWSSIDGHITQQRQFIERLARAHHDRRERVVGECDLQAGLLAQQHVEVAQECAAGLRAHDFPSRRVGGQLRRHAFERDTHRLDDLMPGSINASRISSSVISIILGTPATRLRPFVCISLPE